MEKTVAPLALEAHALHKRFGGAKGQPLVHALKEVDLRVPHGSLTALVGPDGAGKTTLLRLATALMHADGGSLRVLGLDPATQAQQIQDRIGYMPQRFGLYEDLTVQENLNLYADLHGVPARERGERFRRLLHMTDLGGFTSRLAGKLSGGMKQKLGLACTLVRSPELLLLDEPTVGVDPLSRRELWEIVQQLVHEDGLTVLVSTSYLDEAEQCQHVVVLHQGQVLAQGDPQQLRAQAQGHVFLLPPEPGQPARMLQVSLMADPATVDAVPQGGEVRWVRRDVAGAPVAGKPIRERLEDAFMMLLRDKLQGDGAAMLESAVSASAGNATAPAESPAGALRSTDSPSRKQGAAPMAGAAAALPTRPDDAPMIEVKELVRKFGDFVAVDHTTFSVQRGEIFGLLGPNGAGKTTTFRMLCGLLPATSGSLRVAGVDVRHASGQARSRIGYVAQKFSLYGNLSVLENLQFFGSAYGLHGKALAQRIQVLLDEFGLGEQASHAAEALPGGYRQRLAMAAALLHQPEILFLDEATSGADPLARRDFWRRISLLAAAGTTIVVTTHFMEEAEYCDRILIQDAGRMLALGTPREVREQAARAAGHAVDDMDAAFIAIVEHERQQVPT